MTAPRPDAASTERVGGWHPLDDVFAAVADPTRRGIVQVLVHEGPHTATQLATRFAPSRQAIVKHLQALAAAGLVAPERHGREVRYLATTERLAGAVAWLLDASGRWDRRTARLRAAGTAGRR